MPFEVNELPDRNTYIIIAVAVVILAAGGGYYYLQQSQNAAALEVRKQKLAEHHTRSDYVFIYLKTPAHDYSSPVGTRLRRDNWMKIVQNLGEKVNMDHRLRTHIFRISGITNFYNKSKDLILSANYAHHEDPRSTMQYIKVNSSLIIDVLESMHAPSKEVLEKQAKMDRLDALLAEAESIRNSMNGGII